MLCAIAGGVGAARFLRGLAAVVPPETITAIVNTADDTVLHGLHISPDIDTCTYTLAGVSNDELGWGIAGETWTVMEALERLGGPTWFRLGDRDLATHLYRTGRLRDGASLSQVTGELTAALGVAVRLLPMTDARVETRVQLADEGLEIGFQEYFVARHHAVAVSAVRFAGADGAAAGPGVVDAIDTASAVVICPSNPIVSVGPVRAVPEIEAALTRRRDASVAISPIVAGRALKGPADRLLSELGHEVSVVGVARLYSPIAATLVVDVSDAKLADAVEAEGMRCVVTPTVMHGPQEAAELARTVLASCPSS